MASYSRGWSRKGQVKLFESIAVLIIFFFLLSFGFTFYGKMQQVSNEKNLRKAIEIDAVSLAIRTSNLAELQCSMKNVAEPNCYDEFKLRAFAQLLGDTGSRYLTDHYYSVLGYSRIYLQVIYPDTESMKIYDRPRNNESDAGIVTLMPISLLNPATGAYRFAVLNVTYYPPE